MGLFDLENHLIFYRSYHFNPVNVRIHLLCIPIILISAIAMFSPVDVIGASQPFINMGSLIATTYGLYYTALDWKVGSPCLSLLVPLSYVFKKTYMGLTDEKQQSFIYAALGTHVLSWLAQFYGHGVHEKRAPALLDNLLQALVLAPFFVAFEVAFYLGYRKDLQKKMDNKAGKNVLKFRQQEKSRHK
ncbi:Piso0_000350 [Millerozyma farinosa CBS 7064]|uniref:Piso0_000350 protein n=1 Tax=Pichia sorbitophila (strain ATCC MYA-4447 / BCRC 22081 / CBS 7064 / NBRC 10061 / NRRL Y-12695) TaxID=559304 RepID=G8YV73_PICSO|nr:Piso0_000350 [Millerozyma farinosa CBS 7064]CCE73317.1 Piso0_000350 [Millerozyma farinosa CBS 7064]